MQRVTEPVTALVSKFVAETRSDQFPDELRVKAQRIVIDTFGCIVAGAGSEIAPSLLRYLETSQQLSGNVPVLGTDVLASPEGAALVNGSFGHALEFDDVFSMMPGHPAVVILAALVSDMARNKVSGRELTDAFILGYEVCGRLGIALTLEHHRVRGFHATSTMSVVGATAAVARIRKLDANATTRAISVACSTAAGILAQLGTLMKPVHSGWAARSAVSAADLAESGIEGASDVLESPKGFFNAYGTAASQPDRMVKDIANPWVILSPGVSLKKFGCCFAAHRGIDAILTLRERHGIRFDDVAAIECRLPPKGLVNMVHHRPQIGSEGQFSMEYCFVATLLDGMPTLSTFTTAAVQRDIVQRNFGLVSCIEDPACEEGIGEASGEVSGARGYTQITITTKDGKRHAHKVAHAPGTPAREFSPQELEQKIGICGTHAGMPADAIKDMTAKLLAYESASDMKVVLEALRRRSH